MSIEKSLVVGAQIDHPDYGLCTVDYVGDDHVGVKPAVKSSGGGKAILLKRESLIADLERGPSTAKPSAPRPPWPDCTFEWETEEHPHYMGSHWEPFFDDAGEIIDRLPEIIPQAQLHTCYSNVYSASRELPEDWPEGFILFSPDRSATRSDGLDHGLLLTLLIRDNGNELVSCYPYCYVGTDATVKIDKVFVWHGGAEAQIEGTWNSNYIAFFDSSFLINRAHYEAGKHYQFFMLGLAYKAGPAKENTIQVKQGPELAKWQHAVTGGKIPEAGMTKISLEGSAMLFPITKWDRDEYRFRGPVRDVEPFRNWLGQAGWRLRVTVFRGIHDNKDADLNIYVTERAWSGRKPPHVGQDIEGEFWLQGRLWGVNK